MAHFKKKALIGVQSNSKRTTKVCRVQITMNQPQVPQSSICIWLSQVYMYEPSEL